MSYHIYKMIESMDLSFGTLVVLLIILTIVGIVINATGDDGEEE